MDKQQAQKIISETFESSFDKSGFTGFIKNLLNRIDDAPFTYQGNYIPDAYKQYINTLERIGKFSDGENNIDILVITLQKETSLERARTMQRNFIAWYLNGSRGGDMKDAALAAFVSPAKEDWRFSLVKMDYKFEKTKTGRMKVKEEFTPARRWSFLVGENEKSHTAQSRLVDILKETDPKYKPTLAELEKAFDIETVTKEFFLKYRELFLRTKEELDRVVKKDSKIETDFEAKGVDTVNFAKKLLGQIIFLYFLQKKGWFGVGRDDDWGTGTKHFLRELFEKKHADYNNFYNDILEPLFYEALRIDRSHDDGYYSRFDCKIPFLNGGLFDPIGNYDWVHTDIIIPDRLFSNNIKTKEGDTGSGILDVFDRYNFTVKEDEPLEKEVAIDPELLGKSYEKFNAIRPDNFAEFKIALKSGRKGEENKFNKKFGVYYTPREIVHYMCQQSLINYLSTELSDCHSRSTFRHSLESGNPVVSKEDIETLIHTGEQFGENEARVLRKGKETKTYSHQLPESIRNNAALIDEKLADITVCDPAVGSGAFPVGMMNEIVRARNVLSTFIHRQDACSTYEFKRQCIEHSLYGVDIDPGAVEIAKLRLWLSLVVDEDDIKNIKPLPNLDYRIMQGNSLISEFMGINFDSEKEKRSENLMFKDKTDELTEHFQQQKDEFLNESNVSRKSKLKEEVENLLIEIFETKLKTQKADYFSRLEDIENKYSVLPSEKQRDELIEQDKEKLYKESGFDLESAEKQLKEFTSGRKIKPFFLWNLYFSEVFHKKSGFDVVIANPPYLGIKDITWDDRRYYETIFKTATGRFDSYSLFIEKAMQIKSSSGTFAFIIPGKFLNNKQFVIARKIICKNHGVTVVKIDKKVFEEAQVDSVIVENYMPVKFSVPIYRTLRFIDQGIQPLSEVEVVEMLKDPEVIFRLEINTEIDQLISKIRENTFKVKEIGEVKDGIVAGAIKDILFLKRKKDNDSKKLYFGKHITRYNLNKTNVWVNYKPDEMMKEEVKRQGSKRPGLWMRDKNIFEREKIIYRKVGKEIIAAYGPRGTYYEQTIHSVHLTEKRFTLKYLLGLFNSMLFKFYYQITNSHSGNIFPQVRISSIENLPIKLVDKYSQDEIEKLVERILVIIKEKDYPENPKKQAKGNALESEIDQIVYKLYDLTPEEIKIVEGKDEGRNRRN